MAVYGVLHPFDINEEDWKSYIQRAKLYFTANGITDADKQRAIILTCCGPKTFKMVKNIVAPQDPNTVSLDELEKLVGDHYNPKPTATVQRCLFNSRIRQQGESVAEFVAALKKLSEYCGFTDAQLKEMLRDRLICGINNERWQKRLLTEDAADYQKVLDVALSLEAAEKSVQDLRGGAKLNKMGSGDRRPPFKGSGRPQLKGEEVLARATDVEGQTTGPQSATSRKPSATIVVRKAMSPGRAEADQRHH